MCCVGWGRGVYYVGSGVGGVVVDVDGVAGGGCVVYVVAGECCGVVVGVVGVCGGVRVIDGVVRGDGGGVVCRC